MKKILFMTLFLFSLNSNAQSVNALVNLSPAGSFNVKSKAIRGSAVKKGDGYEAKKLTIKVRKLKSGLDLRDEHLHKRLGRKSKIVVTDAKGSGGVGSATIKMNNVKRKIKFKYKAKGNKLAVMFNLNLANFGIKGINYAGVGVEDKVKVKAIIPVK